MNKLEILSKLQENKEILEKQFSVSRIGLFGSYASGAENSNSDIDLIYELQPGRNEGLQDIHDFETFLKYILNGKEIDLVNARFINPIIEHEINSKIIYV